MPEIGLLFFINAALIIHAARGGHFWPWAYVILLLPGIGALAYVFVVLLPEYRGTPRANRVQAGIARRVLPERTYRALRSELQTADTISTRRLLAQECLTLGKYDEALQLFGGIVKSPLGDEPNYYLGKAEAEYCLHDFAATVATLDELKRLWPDFASQDGHLLYARALEELGRSDDALKEYESLSRYSTGQEPQVRRLLLLDQLGRRGEATALAEDVVRYISRSPKFARRQQSQWLSAAKDYLRKAAAT